MYIKCIVVNVNIRSVASARLYSLPLLIGCFAIVSTSLLLKLSLAGYSSSSYLRMMLFVYVSTDSMCLEPQERKNYIEAKVQEVFEANHFLTEWGLEIDTKMTEWDAGMSLFVCFMNCGISIERFPFLSLSLFRILSFIEMLRPPVLEYKNKFSGMAIVSR